MARTQPHITVCICTFKRTALLAELLHELERQETEGLFEYDVVVADNDHARSAEAVVARFRAQAPVPVTYCSEPRQNIALARNKALEHAAGDWIAFIDDDEVPTRDWLVRLLMAATASGADAVLGPVRPRFDQPPPSWIVKGRFFERPEYPTGRRLHWSETRTGNVLFRREMLNGFALPFRPEFGTGSEDVDFFRRMAELNRTFVWCSEAAVHERVPAERCTRSYLLRRAAVIGSNSFRHPAHRVRNLIKSAAAVPLYALALPFLGIRGQHAFMMFLTKLLYHASRILSLFGWHPGPGRPAGSPG